MTLRTRVVFASVVGSLGVFGVAASVGPSLGLGAAYPWDALAAFVGMMAIATILLGRHPFPRFGPANHVTMIRVLLVALVAALIRRPALPGIAVGAVCVVAVVLVLDGADGWLARRSRMASDFGAWFDMETDALLVLVMSVLVWQHGKAGAWVLLCGLMRYAFLTAGWFLPWMRRELRSTLRGKTVCVAQVCGLALAMVPIVATPLSTGVAALVLAAVSWSFAVDVTWLWRSQFGSPVSRQGIEVT